METVLVVAITAVVYAGRAVGLPSRFAPVTAFGLSLAAAVLVMTRGEVAAEAVLVALSSWAGSMGTHEMLKNIVSGVRRTVRAVLGEREDMS